MLEVSGMKIDGNLLRKCYYDTMVLQYKNELEKQGYLVSLGYSINGIILDLYAEKDAEKRAYEFKLVGNRDYANGSIKKFKERVESLGIIPYVIYVNPPAEKNISFENLDMLLAEYFVEHSLPPELSALSPNTLIDYVEIDKLTNVDIADDEITVDGYASISVKILLSSGSESTDSDIDEYAERFPMSFNVKLRQNGNYSIDSVECDIDTSSWYD